MSQLEHSEFVYYPKWDGAFLNCSMAYECSADWHKLTQTARHDVRHCVTCDKDVYFCTDQKSLDEHAIQGHCVAFYEGCDESSRVDRKSGMRVGVPKYLIKDGVAVSYSWKMRRAIESM